MTLATFARLFPMHPVVLAADGAAVALYARLALYALGHGLGLRLDKVVARHLSGPDDHDLALAHLIASGLAVEGVDRASGAPTVELLDLSGKLTPGAYDALVREWQSLRPTVAPIVLARAGGRCAYCVEAPATEVDHKRPLVRGGSNAMGNLAASCAPCNMQKGAKTAEEYASWKGRP